MTRDNWLRVLVGSTMATLFVGCQPSDSTITRGAADAGEFKRRVISAIPIGLSADSARTRMGRNGFSCQSGADSSAYIRCDKSQPRLLENSHWQAVFYLDGRRTVGAVGTLVEVSSAGTSALLPSTGRSELPYDTSDAISRSLKSSFGIGIPENEVPRARGLVSDSASYSKADSLRFRMRSGPMDARFIPGSVPRTWHLTHPLAMTR